ncbi:hypothetical protein RFI_06569 [Reticulomyxa filosa]|uniref:Protein kinase domain-containing protein n=1 Tax=Reticulomyxa filosa TaxID=46433 RepID=X6NX21_RETFI|nr:hypothetical protein RFI_06569 [Reticulomyxa filosa]|eukprot:ETO30551.1 hypothetical protein RFI_06569 [Reticulomyxa filosa]
MDFCCTFLFFWIDKQTNQKKRSIRAMYGMITSSQYLFPKPDWDHISPDTISCIKGLMHVDPQQRLNCDTLCQHPFIRKHVDLKALEEEEEREQLPLQSQPHFFGQCLSYALPECTRFIDLSTTPVVHSSNQTTPLE